MKNIDNTHKSPKPSSHFLTLLQFLQLSLLTVCLGLSPAYNESAESAAMEASLPYEFTKSQGEGCPVMRISFGMASGGLASEVIFPAPWYTVDVTTATWSSPDLANQLLTLTWLEVQTRELSFSFNVSNAGSGHRPATCPPLIQWSTNLSTDGWIDLDPTTSLATLLNNSFVAIHSDGSGHYTSSFAP